MEKVIFQDMGQVPYKEAWAYQTQVHEDLKARKMENRRRQSEGAPAEAQPHRLIFCEHPPVYTLGKSGSMDHLLLNEEGLEQEGFEFFRINRGGDITYHGPGQIVGYPIFDLDCFFTDVHRYVRGLEEAVIRTIADYGLEGIRIKEYTGVWLDAAKGRPQRKICAIGVHLSRWVTMHGFAFNVNPRLADFGNIIPCGIADQQKSVTSMALELGQSVNIEEVKNRLKGHFAEIFEFVYAN